MSFAYSGAEPQPSLAWQFESSNVDSVTGLAPSSQVSPGPAQLVGGASLVTNAPTSNTAVYFDGSTGTYMNLGAGSSTNFNYSTSNLFVEAWVYLNTTMIDVIISRDNGGSLYDWDIDVRNTTGPAFFVNTSGGAKVASNSSALSLNTWYHIACAIDITNLNLYIFVNGGVSTPTAYTGTINYNSGYTTRLGVSARVGGGTVYANQYIRDLRVVQGGVVPTTSFTPGSAPFSYALPSYVTGSGSVVFTLLGQFITYPTGKYGQGISFTNQINFNYTTANSYIIYTVSSARNITSNNSTYSIWINPQYPNLPTLAALRAGKQNILQIVDSVTNYSLQTNGYMSPGGSNGVYFIGGQNSNIAFSSSLQAYNSGTWCHLCVVLSNVSTQTGYTTSYFYFNGVLQGSNVHSTGSASPISALWLSAQVNGVTDGVMGGSFYLDDLRIYNTALTAAQVQSIYRAQGMPSRGVQVNQYIKSATGGDTVQDIGGYRIHTFTTVGTSTFTPATAGNVEVLVVAGGGGGGANNASYTPGGGGGAGEVFYSSSFPVSGVTTVTVGAGGDGGIQGTEAAKKGSSSIFGSISTNGGGLGGSGQGGQNGGSGGSGGGSARGAIGGSSIKTAEGYGNDGGSSTGTSGAGGGGALSVGGSTSTSTIGIGGDGISLNISGSMVTYGTGGNGGSRNNNTPGGNASVNTGNGGGGAGGNGISANGGSGGSGIVIVRYPLPVRMTGTPLFSQLSTAARSSAVGAFSLRAVNGTSAKAVNVQANITLPSMSIFSARLCTTNSYTQTLS